MKDSPRLHDDGETYGLVDRRTCRGAGQANPQPTCRSRDCCLLCSTHQPILVQEHLERVARCHQHIDPKVKLEPIHQKGLHAGVREGVGAWGQAWNSEHTHQGVSAPSQGIPVPLRPLLSEAAPDLGSGGSCRGDSYLSPPPVCMAHASLTPAPVSCWVA